MGVDRRSRSLGFLTWIQDPENREEVIALFLIAKEFGKTPSYYAFGDKIPLTSQYEIDFYVMCVGKDHEAELLEEQKREMAQGRS